MRPDDETEQIKREVDLMQLVRDSGVALRQVGKEWKGRCLWHQDKTPSLSVRPERGVWRCFACSIGGSCFDWVMKRDGVSFAEAKVVLRRYLPAYATTPAAPESRWIADKVPRVLTATADDHERLMWVVEQYHQLLLSGMTPASGYLVKRGIGDPEAIRTFKLGYAERALACPLPPQRKYRGDDDPRQMLARIGIKRVSGHEHFAGSLVIPVIDEDGHVSEIYGRKASNNLRAGTPRHLYLDASKRLTKTRGVWNWQGLREETILCEGLIDALTFWCNGYENVTACYGADVFPQAHVDAFVKHGVKRVLIAFDRDEAGDRGAATVKAKLAGVGIGCFRVKFPHGMDANEYASKVRPA